MLDRRNIFFNSIIQLVKYQDKEMSRYKPGRIYYYYRGTVLPKV